VIAEAARSASPNPGALRYVARRLGQAAIVLGIVIVVQFFLLHLAPGDIADVIAGEVQASDRAFVDKLRRELGLDRPLPVQLALFSWRIVQLDFGQSHAFSLPVIQVIAERLPATLLLMASSIALAFVLGTALGMAAALRAGKWLDVAISTAALVFYATPAFLAGLALILIFSVQLNWLPMTGMGTTWLKLQGWEWVVDIARHLVMPMTALALFYVAIYTRLMRASMLEVMNLDYVRTARAKGLPPARIVLRHMARNALLPVFTMLGLQVASLLGGAVLIETVFGWPGIGRLAFEGVFRRDVPLVMGILFLSSVLVLVANLAMDLLYTRLDPRIVMR
jgi:peptide/nickel transport system permease protein